MTLSQTEARALAKQAGSLKLLCIFCWGRSGSIFLGSLLDGHPNLLTISHQSLFHNFFSKVWPCAAIWLSENPTQSNEALVDFLLPQLPGILSNTPGVREDLITAVDQVHHLTARSLFCLLHLVYENRLGINLERKTMINFQFHGPAHLGELNTLLEIWPDAVLLGIYREPLRTLVSLYKSHLYHAGDQTNVTIENYELAYQKASYSLWYRGMLLGWHPISRYFNVNIHEVGLEQLHADPESTMLKLTRDLDLPWDETLLESTFGGKSMIQGSHSQGKPLSGFRQTPESPIEWEPILNALDVFVFRGLMRKVINEKGYGRISRFHHALAVLLSLVPMKMETKAFMNAFLNGRWQLLRQVGATWRDRIATVAGMTLGRSVTVRDPRGDDLLLSKVAQTIKEKESYVDRALALMKKQNGVTALAPANELTRMLLSRMHLEGHPSPPVFDLRPNQPFTVKLRAYEDLKGVDTFVICSPAHHARIKLTLEQNGARPDQIKII